MNWKFWLGLVLIAALGGFWYGNSRLGTRMATRAADAEQQIHQLGVQVENELRIRGTHLALLAEAQSKQRNTDARVQQLTQQLAQHKPPLMPSPATGPVVPPLERIPIPADDPTKDELIAAQAQDIAELKDVAYRQSIIITADNLILPQMQKEIDLGRIALEAQVAATRSAKWSGRFQGAGVGITVGFAGGIILGHHFFK